ncbi:Type IV pilus biogenesis protein PilN [Photobacterium marinum]|uniref:Type IV pilus biogenesis protein PilN n=1 Tax=Photobacterium marinum TaxID=1056511 RepID=L8J4Y8_9GAMM|nr:PilN domain-containing protein [Photobacterium marinum]ELR63940.1 Type IV pilus biogenesis protein PilN [Photobacterium marinum]
MIERINLLPWREEKRRLHRRRFFSLLGGAVAGAVLLLWGSASYTEHQKLVQQARNQQLQQEIFRLERELKLLPELDQRREALNQRLGVIAEIQQERNRVTHLLSMLPSLVPQGVYLDDVVMTVDRIAVNGVGESNGRLAAMLSNAEGSVWFKDVIMHSIIATKGKKNQDQIKFKASFVMTSPRETGQAMTVLAKGEPSE